MVPFFVMYIGQAMTNMTSMYKSGDADAALDINTGAATTSSPTLSLWVWRIWMKTCWQYLCFHPDSWPVDQGHHRMIWGWIRMVPFFVAYMVSAGFMKIGTHLIMNCTFMVSHLHRQACLSHCNLDLDSRIGGRQCCLHLQSWTFMSQSFANVMPWICSAVHVCSLCTISQ